MKKVGILLVALMVLGVGSAASAKAENVVTLGIYQEPETLNLHIGVQTVVTYVVKPTAEFLIDVDEKGNYVPVLVKEIPTVKNKGVSKDGLTITYRLKEGIKWSDGREFTSEDVKFTWQAIMNEKNLVRTRSGYELIESVETPDKYTAVVKYKEFFAPYLTRFSPVLPKHALANLPNMNDAPYNRKPIGTGPFMVTEWVSGDHITMVKNPYYRDADKVKIDKVFFKIIPSREVGIAQIKAGDIDGVWDLIEAQIPQMERNPDINLCLSNALVAERLILNLSTTEAPNNGNPDFPHPILGDLRVRQALQFAIDKKLLTERLLYGKAKVTEAAIPDGWAANKKLKPTPYDPKKAAKLLDKAGWKMGKNNIREKNGQKLRLKITTTTGNKLREMVEQVLVSMVKKVGMDLYIENQPSSVLFGSWANDADRKKGRYDIMMYTTGPGIDPHQHFEGYYHSSKIPTDANGGAGFNYTRHRDEKLDKWIDAAGSSADMKKRAKAYRKAQSRLAEILPHIFLYRRINVHAFNKRVKGWKENGYGIIDSVETWNIADWYIEK